MRAHANKSAAGYKHLHKLDSLELTWIGFYY